MVTNKEHLEATQVSTITSLVEELASKDWVDCQVSKDNQEQHELFHWGFATSSVVSLLY